MARRISSGISGRSVLGSIVAVNNSLQSVVNNENIVLDPNGTGKVVTSAQIEFNNSTESTSTSTGALVISGGAGVQGNINLSGNISDGQGFSTSSQHFTVPSGSIANRPATPQNGYVRFNTDYNLLETYNGNKWVVQGFQDIDVISSRTAKAYENNWVNTSGGSITVTLPASPSKGDEIRFFDVGNSFNSNPLTVNRNGNSIMGAADNLTVSTEGAAFSLVYYNTTAGWRILTV